MSTPFMSPNIAYKPPRNSGGNLVAFRASDPWWSPWFLVASTVSHKSSVLSTHHQLLTRTRIHTHASIRGGESNEDEMSRTGEFKETSIAARVAQQKWTVSQWALQWRSIILSSLGKTAFPYCLYIQSLDLRNLVDLLEDDIFRDNFQDMFFWSLQPLDGAQSNSRTLRSKGKERTQFNIPLIINSVGESISRFVGDSANMPGTTAALDAIDLSGNINPVEFPTWIGRLPRLESMALWDGTVLNGHVGEVIRMHCQNFKSLSIYTCHGDKVDFNLASFLNALPINTLRSLRVFSYNDIAGETFKALNQHRESLADLALGNLKDPAIRSLSVLKGLTALQNLDLDDAQGRINLESTANGSFLDVIEWVTGCTQLKTICLNRFVDGPAIVKAVCSNNEIRLNSLTLRGYTFANNIPLHSSLSNQPELESLELRAETEEDEDDSTYEDIETLVNSTCFLQELRYLNLLDTSNNFNSIHIELLASSLRKVSALPRLIVISMFHLSCYSYGCLLFLLLIYISNSSKIYQSVATLWAMRFGGVSQCYTKFEAYHFTP